jgi:hypothetical protein
MQTTYDLEMARDEIGAKIKARVHPRAGRATDQTQMPPFISGARSTQA